MKGPCKLEQILPAPMKNKVVAVAAACLLAAGSVFGIGGAKLASYANSTAAAFSDGMYSIAADLDARLNSAANLVTVAEKVSGVSAGSVEAVRSAVVPRDKRGPIMDAVNAAQGPAAKAAADTALDSAVNALYDEAVALADANQYDLLAGELAEFNARGNTIRNNDYNSRAQEFNDTLAGQPAKLIGALWGIEEAEYYR